MAVLVEQLKKTFEERKNKNSAYSIRAFAKSLDLDSSSLSAILRGKRPVSHKLAQKLIEGLGIVDPMLAQSLIVDTLSKQTISSDQIMYSELAMHKAEATASWYYFAILAVMELHQFRGTEKEIAKRLNIPLSTVTDALSKMAQLDLLEKKGMKWILTGRNVATTTPVANQALREGHKQNINKALESLELDSVELRDISGITMAINPSKIPEAKKLIQDFRRRMSAFLESGQRSEVYRLNIQLFPLTKGENK